MYCRPTGATLLTVGPDPKKVRWQPTVYKKLAHYFPIYDALFFSHADFKVYRLLSISVDELTKKSKTTAVTMGLLSILRKLKSSPDRELRILLLGK